jgi:glucose-6-phosphate isomerase
MSGQLTVDLNLATKEQVASGLTREDYGALREAVAEGHKSLAAGRASGQLAFLDLPRDEKAAEDCRALARELSGWAENLVVLGIGGSSLGAKALFAGLSHPFHNLQPGSSRTGMRLFFPDNSDPATFGSLLEVIDLKKTAFAAITKSGGTAETWAQLLVVEEKLAALGPDASARHVVAVTDPEKGALRTVATQQRWKTLPVPPRVGGRFSVFTAVGLLPAAAAGIDTRQLLAGAAAMVERCGQPEALKNPAYALASTLYLMDVRAGRRTHVFMPYVDALRETADWYVQLWAESLGKRSGANGERAVGPTPLRAVGATDQHSLLQLLMEGPQDKVTVFVTVDRPRRDLTIPKGHTDVGDVGYLGGHTFHALLSAEQRATAAALAAGGRPSLTIRLPELTPFALGELLMLWEIATAFAGTLYGVDPFDQPGVEAGKRYACGLLGRPGYESSREELGRRPASRPEWVL